MHAGISIFKIAEYIGKNKLVVYRKINSDKRNKKYNAKLPEVG